MKFVVLAVVLSILCFGTLEAAKSAEGGGGCICTADFSPVCGKNGKTYSNACKAKCEKQPVAHTGSCDGKSGGKTV
ncbi:bdellin B-3-like [Paramacrobiotus metropolitanus]|uniref:bdellin B-3-like n=1 Tax=Paramacrobiotus metropolitanus TaxID=2943436 RepID=UPI002445DF6E|nr:bdellin B-3-like [Paramacrobiotus metropolitanus]